MVTTKARTIRLRDPGITTTHAADPDDVVRRLHAARKIAPVPMGLDQILPPSGLAHAQAAGARLADAIQRGERIAILGDYDCDGAVATSLMVIGLRRLGALSVQYLVPDRMRHGYGLSPGIVPDLLALHPQVVVTVDNGIAAAEGVALLKSAGVSVIVTDHHLSGPTLPAADVIVNPNQPGDAFASKALAGCGVAFYVLLETRATLRDRGRYQGTRPQPALSDLLALVALGTVADVVPLDANNRLLVSAGLQRMRTHPGPGLSALAQAAGRDVRYLQAQDLAFALGPRLNAAGRLADMRLGIECLIATDARVAAAHAAALQQMNADRQQLGAEMETEATAMADEIRCSGTWPVAICLHSPRWHAGLVGLLAGRIREYTYRPTLVFTDSEPGIRRGSGRSIPGLHLRDALVDVDSQHPGLMVRFGGHAAAAGLEVRTEHWDAFVTAFTAAVARRLPPDALEEVLWVDGGLAPACRTLETATAIETAGPWGAGCPEPVFVDEFRVVGTQMLKAQHLRCQLADPDGHRLPAIAFNHPPVPEGTKARVVYRLSVNRFRDQTTAQAMIEQLDTTTGDMTG